MKYKKVVTTEQIQNDSGNLIEMAMWSKGGYLKSLLCEYVPGKTPIYIAADNNGIYRGEFEKAIDIYNGMTNK